MFNSKSNKITWRSWVRRLLAPQRFVALLPCHRQPFQEPVLRQQLLLWRMRRFSMSAHFECQINLGKHFSRRLAIMSAGLSCSQPRSNLKKREISNNNAAGGLMLTRKESLARRLLRFYDFVPAQRGLQQSKVETPCTGCQLNLKYHSTKLWGSATLYVHKIPLCENWEQTCGGKVGKKTDSPLLGVSPPTLNQQYVHNYI